MKNFLYSIIAVLFICSTAQSQDFGKGLLGTSYGELNLGAGIGGTVVMGNFSKDYQPQMAFGFTADYRFAKNISAGFDALFSTAFLADQGSPRYATQLSYICPNVKYKFWLKPDKSALYLQTGPGFYQTSSYNYSRYEYLNNQSYEYRYYHSPSTKVGFHAGGGIDVYLSRLVQLNFNALLHNYYDSKRNNAPFQFATILAGVKIRAY